MYVSYNNNNILILLRSNTCIVYVPEEVKMYSLIKLVFECIFERWEKELVLHINFKKRKIFVSNEKYGTSKIFFGETKMKMIDISCTIVFCEVLRHCRIQSVLVKSEIHTHFVGGLNIESKLHQSSSK